MAEYLKKVDLLSAAVEVEYLGRPRMMVSVAKIGQMPSIEAVPMEYHNKVCEEMARRHQAEIAELTADRPQGEWFKDDEGTFICSACGSGYKDQPTLMGKPLFKWCPLCGARMKGADDVFEGDR